MPITSYDTYTRRNVRRYSIWLRTTPGGTQTMELVRTPKYIGDDRKMGKKDTDWRVKVAKLQNAGSARRLITWQYLVPYDVHFIGESYSPSQKIVQTARLIGFDNHGVSRIIDDGLRDVALQRLKRKLSGKLGNADLLVPTVELRELRKSIRDSAALSSKLLVGLSKLRKDRGRSLASAMQDMWLTYSFAVAPLIGDTIKALDAIRDYQTRPRNMHRIRGSASSTRIGGSAQVSGSQDGWARSTHTVIRHEVQYTYTAGINFALLSGNNYGIGEHLGFDGIGGQLPSIAWELMPFSWVLDYFTTMGAYMEDTFVLPSGSTVYVTLSHLSTAEVFETKRVVRQRTPTSWGTFELRQVSQPMLGRRIDFERTVLSALPYRSLRIKSVDEIGRNAVSRLLNLSSILKIKG